MSEEIKQDLKESEELIELSVDDLEAILASGTDTPINIAELLETETASNRVLYLSQEVTVETIDYMIQLINMWNKIDYGLDVTKRIPIELHLNSPGGDLYASLQLASALENSVTPVKTFAYGLVASASMVLFICGHERYMSKFANLLYHELRASSDVTTLLEMKNIVKHYNKLQNTLDNFILERTDISEKKLKKKRGKNMDWYITAEKALKWNICDQIIE